MNSNRLARNVIILCGIFFILTLGLYIGNFATNGFSKNISAWAGFGDYFGGVMGVVLTITSIILIFLTYRNQVRSSSTQQASTSLQLFESTYFNLLQTHQLTVERYQRRNGDIKNEYNKYRNKTSQVSLDNLDNKDFFDMLYFILDGNYKDVIGKFDNKPFTVNQKVQEFFKNHYWMIGNYVRSFTAIMEYVDKNGLGDKRFYIEMLRDMATMDELRLLFYATIWRTDLDGKKWKDLFDRYEIFSFIGNHPADKKLSDPEADWKAYQDI